MWYERLENKFASHQISSSYSVDVVLKTVDCLFDLNRVPIYWDGSQVLRSVEFCRRQSRLVLVEEKQDGVAFLPTIFSL